MAAKRKKFYGPEVYALGEHVNAEYQPLTQADIKKVKADVSHVQEQLEGIPTDVTHLQEDVNQLEEDVETLRTDVDGKFDKTGGTITGGVIIQSTTPSLTLRGPEGTSNGSLYFGNGNHGVLQRNGNDLIVQTAHSITGTSGHILFVNGHTSQKTEKFRLDRNGNVGIGTQAPTAKLHVQQDLNTAPAFRVDDETGDTTYFFVDQTGRVRVNTNVSDAATETFVVNGSTRLRGDVYLDSSATTLQTQLGNKQDKVSGVTDTHIGYLSGVTSNVQTQLNSKAATTALNSRVAKAGDTMTGDLIIENTNPSLGVRHPSNILGAVWLGTPDYGIRRDGGAIELHTATSSVLSFYQGPKQASGGVERMRIHSDGNVGIGTKTPGSALEVNGTIRSSALTSGRVLTSGANGSIRDSQVTSTELNYLQNATSNIQEQIDAIWAHINAL